MLRARATTTILVAVSWMLLSGCGGASKPVAAAPAAPVDSPGLTRLRAGYASFAASSMESADFDALAALHDAERDHLAPAGRAEADLLLAFAGTQLIERSFDQLADPDAAAHELLAVTVLPLVWRERPLDGESAPAFRDRLCQGAGAAVCNGALPDFWGAALVYEASRQLATRAQTLAAACGCARRYGAELTRTAKVADAARVHESDQRPGWGLDMDNLARSAFATPDWPPGDVRVRVRVAALLPAKRKALAARLAELRSAAAKPGEGGALLLEIDALADTKLADLAQVVAAARDAGWAGLLLTVRVAAPPNPRGFLRVELTGARAPKGTTALAIAGKKAGMQGLVDQIDAAYGTSDTARVVWVVK